MKRTELHYCAFDWDDNILHMPTKIHMEKKEGDEWIPVDVSTAEFAIVRNDKDYRIASEKAFLEFRDVGERGKYAFVEDTIIAIKYKEFGPSWDAFIKCLEDGSIFAIITARGHEPQTIKDAVIYIINNCLTEDQKFNMYSNCLKEAYLFSDENVDKYSRIIRGTLSDTPLIQAYLDSCFYYGVSSEAFANEFGRHNASNPEHAKKLALDKFIKVCNDYGRKVGAKSVSIGFSDDDPKNVEHVKQFFKEKSALSFNDILMKYNVYKTTDRNIKGGERTKYREGDLYESSTWGMESSVIPFTKWNNMTQRLYPSGDNSKNDFHNQMKNRVNQANDLYKEFAYKRKKKK